MVAGGGHVALAIARQAQLLDFDVTILEDRPEFADPKRFGGATVLEGDVPTMIGSLDYGWNSFVVIATRGHKLDADCILAAVQTNAQYIGLLGPRARADEMLAQLGSAGDARVFAPVGLNLGADGPEQIAISVVSELLAFLSRQQPGHLREKREAIHAF